MVLVDTSVLIDFFKGNSNTKSEKFEYVIKNSIPFGINGLIYQEILQGAANESEFEKLKIYLITQNFYNMINGISSFEEASKIFIKCRQKGYTVRSTIDLIIAQTAIENNLFLLHNDSDFDIISKVTKDLKIY